MIHLKGTKTLDEENNPKCTAKKKEERRHFSFWSFRSERTAFIDRVIIAFVQLPRATIVALYFIDFEFLESFFSLSNNPTTFWMQAIFTPQSLVALKFIDYYDYHPWIVTAISSSLILSEVLCYLSFALSAKEFIKGVNKSVSQFGAVIFLCFLCYPLVPPGMLDWNVATYVVVFASVPFVGLFKKLFQEGWSGEERTRRTEPTCVGGSTSRGHTEKQLEKLFDYVRATNNTEASVMPNLSTHAQEVFMNHYNPRPNVDYEANMPKDWALVFALGGLCLFFSLGADFLMPQSLLLFSLSPSSRRQPYFHSSPSITHFFLSCFPCARTLSSLASSWSWFFSFFAFVTFQMLDWKLSQVARNIAFMPRMLVMMKASTVALLMGYLFLCLDLWAKVQENGLGLIGNPPTGLTNQEWYSLFFLLVLFFIERQVHKVLLGKETSSIRLLALYSALGTEEQKQLLVMGLLEAAQGLVVNTNEVTFKAQWIPTAVATGGSLLKLYMAVGSEMAGFAFPLVWHHLIFLLNVPFSFSMVLLPPRLLALGVFLWGLFWLWVLANPSPTRHFLPRLSLDASQTWLPSKEDEELISRASRVCEGCFSLPQIRQIINVFQILDKDQDLVLGVEDLMGFTELQNSQEAVQELIASCGSHSDLIEFEDFVSSLVMVKRGQPANKLATLLSKQYLANIFAPPPTVTSSNRCVICLTNTRNILIKPCRHVCLCEECALEMEENSSHDPNNKLYSICPLCRTPVRKTSTVYF